MDTSGVRNGMQVIGSDGGMVGTVEGVEGDRVRLQPAAPAGGGQYHSIPAAWVTRVDEHVHLDREAALVREEWTAEGEAATAAPMTAATGARRPAPGQDPGRSRWIPWSIGVVFLLVIVYLAVRAFTYGADERADTTQPLPSADSDATGTGVGNDSD